MFPQVLGTVADMFHVEERYRDALEVGLGDLSHSLITKDRSTAVKILQKANEVNAGDLTIIPLEEALKLKKDLKSPPELGKKSKRASELVQTSKELKPLADYILGNLFIIDQIDSELNNHSMIGYNIVDLAGNFSGNDLVFSNGDIVTIQWRVEKTSGSTYNSNSTYTCLLYTSDAADE